MGAPKRIHFDEMSDKLIRNAYVNGTRKSGAVNAVAEKLGISTTTVHRRAAFLGVVRAGYKTQLFWREEEVYLLEKFAHLTIGAIIERLIKAGYPRRTEHSILQKMKQLGLGQRQSRYDAGIYSIKELERLSGIQSRTLAGYIEKGWLKAKRRTGITQLEYDILAKDVRQFFKDYAINVDIVRCDKYWLIDVLTGEIK